MVDNLKKIWTSGYFNTPDDQKLYNKCFSDKKNYTKTQNNQLNHHGRAVRQWSDAGRVGVFFEKVGLTLGLAIPVLRGHIIKAFDRFDLANTPPNDIEEQRNDTEQSSMNSGSELDISSDAISFISNNLEGPDSIELESISIDGSSLIKEIVVHRDTSKNDLDEGTKVVIQGNEDWEICRTVRELARGLGRGVNEIIQLIKDKNGDELGKMIESKLSTPQRKDKDEFEKYATKDLVNMKDGQVETRIRELYQNWSSTPSFPSEPQKIKKTDENKEQHYLFPSGDHVVVHKGDGRLGVGTDKRVMIASNLSEGTLYAFAKVKTATGSPEQIQEDAQRVRQEINMLSSLDHPNIVKLIYHKELESKKTQTPKFELGYEFLNAGTLSDAINSGQLDRKDKHKQKVLLTGIVKGVVSGLAYLHKEEPGKKPILHGDLTPGNIMLNAVHDPQKSDSDYEAKIIDLGFAQHPSEDMKFDPTVSIQFQAPNLYIAGLDKEKAKSALEAKKKELESSTADRSEELSKEIVQLEEVIAKANQQMGDLRNDVFSLGHILYYMKYYRPPLHVDSSDAMRYENYKDTESMREKLKQSFPKEIVAGSLDDLICRMLDPVAENRPSAEEVKDELERLSKDGSIF